MKHHQLTQAELDETVRRIYAEFPWTMRIIRWSLTPLFWFLTLFRR